ncbi:MAG: 16S rRNA (cytosine(1402)-N(4))-methyltransferase RsmH [Candidatus Saccharimonadales bacterium]
MHQNPHIASHEPVLLAETLAYLNPQKGDKYLDVTAGYGGHASAVLGLSANYSDSVLVDRDAAAIKELAKKFSSQGIKPIHSDYLSASRKLLKANCRFDLIMADLGVSSPHLNEVKRGFSFAAEGPLDMRMDPRQEVTAWTIVNRSSEADLADILWRYGEEPKARQVARLIVRRRPLSTTTELAAAAKKAWPDHSRSHPARRTFQAVRIAVNSELDQLAQALPIWLKLLEPGGRLAIISFHSLEDRIVKQFLAGESGETYDAKLKLLTKHPIVPGPHETAHNPRARSAKLRAAVKQT